MERTISHRELREWQIYAAKHPFGAERDNLHAGLIAAAIYNVSTGKRGRRMMPADFMPFLKNLTDGKRRQADLEADLKAKLIGRRFNGDGCRS